MYITQYSENPKGKQHIRNLHTNGMIIFKRIIMRKQTYCTYGHRAFVVKSVAGANTGVKCGLN